MQTPITTGETRLISLLGSPVRHSGSPATHTLSFNKLGLNAVYVVFDVQPEDLGSIVGAMRVLDGWDGSNVTMPCKQAIIPYLDGLSPAAELMGAVNVLKKEDDGRIIGHNTDGVGFMENLRKQGVRTDGARMVLLGAGGAGSAVFVQAALDGVDHIDLFVRFGGKSHTHAQELIPRVCAQTSCTVDLHDFSDMEALKACIAASDVLVNATNVGMGEGSTETPVPAELLDPSTVVADVVYIPRETQLLRDAHACGCQTVGGVGMMLEQAAAGEAIWYGVDMPTEEVAHELFG